MDLSSFLVWLSGAGALIAASWVLGQFAWYANLVEKTKQWVFFGLSLLFAGGSFAVTNYVSADVLSQIAPWFLIVAFVFVSIFINKSYTRLSELAKTIESIRVSLKKK